MKNKKLSTQLSLSVAFCCAALSIPSFASDFIAPAMVNIPTGEFMMGSNIGDKSASPMHSVSVEAFQMAKYPVTVAEFRKFIEDTSFPIEANCKDKLDKNWLSSPNDVGTARWDKNRYLKSEYQPVTCMNMREAQAYIDWLNEKTNGGYRLPTEEEFEYALKANTTSRYFWGDDFDMSQACLYGNFADRSGEYHPNQTYGASYVGFIGHANCDDGEPYISITGLYRPNPFGLYDMDGNVSQLLGSCYYEGYRARTEQELDIEQCEFIGHRGSTWHFPPQPSQERGRYKRVGWSPGAMMGFRLARNGQSAKVHSSTAQFEQDLLHAQKTRLATRPTLPAAPQSVQLLPLEKNKYTLSWQPSRDQRVIGYDIYRSITPYGHLLGGFFENHYEQISSVSAVQTSIPVSVTEVGNSFRIVSKTRDWGSLPTPAVVIEQEKIVQIPGRFDMRDATELNNVWARHRKAKESEPEFYFLSKVNHLHEQLVSTIHFDIDVKQAGWYKLNYRGNSRQDGEFFKLWIDNKLIKRVAYESDIDDKQGQRHTLYLEKGRHQLALTVQRVGFDYWALGWLELQPIES